jgi:quercetin dioxygenase-like cupin family protein
MGFSCRHHDAHDGAGVTEHLDHMTLPVLGGARLIAREEPFAGVIRASYQSAKATMAAYVFAPCSAFPVHSHAEQQIAIVCDGEVEFVVAGESHQLTAGQTFVVAPNMEQSLQAGVRGARFRAIVLPPRSQPTDTPSTIPTMPSDKGKGDTPTWP